MKILSSEQAGHCQNSSLQRGHLVFTSLISYNGKILFLESHIERLVKGADFLFPNVGWIHNKEKIRHYVDGFTKELPHFSTTHQYFRLTIFDDYFYLQNRELEAHNDSLKLTTALKVKTPGLIPSFLKLSNYIESDLELVRAKFKNYDDILFFDNSDNLTEASTSNVFIVNSEGRIMTPAPSSLILDGVTRKKLFEKLQNLGFNIEEASISKADLMQAREIWLTNSVKGLRFAHQYEDLSFDKNNSIFNSVKIAFGRYGELS